MTGGNILSIGEKDFGIVPRAVRTIFDTVQVSEPPYLILRSSPSALQKRKDCQVIISASYLELYKDDIIDLLDVNDKDLDVRDDAAGNTGECSRIGLKIASSDGSIEF